MIEADPNRSFVVDVFDAGSNQKVSVKSANIIIVIIVVLFVKIPPVFFFSLFKILDAALKQFKSLAPKTAALLFSVDEENSKIICLAQVPKVC